MGEEHPLPKTMLGSTYARSIPAKPGLHGWGSRGTFPSTLAQREAAARLLPGTDALLPGTARALHRQGGRWKAASWPCETACLPH